MRRHRQRRCARPMGRRAPLASAVALLSVICATSAQETPLVGAPYEGLSGVVGDVEIVVQPCVPLGRLAEHARAQVASEHAPLAPRAQHHTE